MIPRRRSTGRDNFLRQTSAGRRSVWGRARCTGSIPAKGRLIAPSYVGHKVDGEGRGQSVHHLFRRWRARAGRPGGVVPWVPEFRHGECTIVERRDGSLLMNMRTSAPGVYSFGYRLTSVSADHGMTWSKPVVDKNLPCPACQASMIRLNGKEMLFLNPAVNHHGGFSIWSRKKLTLRLSRDEGRSWEASRVLNEGLAGYSDLAIAKKRQHPLSLRERGAGLLREDHHRRTQAVLVDPGIEPGDPVNGRKGRFWVASAVVACANETL